MLRILHCSQCWFPGQGGGREGGGLGGARDGGGPWGDRIGGGPGGERVGRLGGAEEEGCIRGLCSAGGGGGGGRLCVGALTASSFTRVKLMHRPCRHTADGRISDS